LLQEFQMQNKIKKIFGLSSESEAVASRVNGLDTLRSIAILFVFMYHYQVFVSHEATFGWASTVGWVGVDLFFVLSGYLIGNQIFSGISKGQQLSIKSFYMRRFLRTLPNYYFILALYFLFPAVMGGNEPPPLWKFVLFVQNMWLTPGTAFSHAWSLCIEEQFYLLFPLVIVFGFRFARTVRTGWLFLLMLIVIGIAVRSILWLEYGLESNDINGYYPNVYYSSFCRFDEFLPGIAVAMLKNFHPAAWAAIIRKGTRTFVFGLLATALMLYGVNEYYYIDNYGYGYFMSGFGYSLLAIAFAILVMSALSPASILHRLRIPGAAALAAYSYAIYLSHKPLAFILKGLLEPYKIASSMQVIIISMACVLAGWLMYRFIETPFMDYRAKRFPTSFKKPASDSMRNVSQLAS